jgi:uncharacterized protein
MSCPSFIITKYWGYYPMKRLIRTVLIAPSILVGLLAARNMAAEANADRVSAEKLNVAVVTGGHPFNEPEFLKLIQGYDDITYKHLPQKMGGEVFDNIADWPYDVIVLYNYNQHITPKQQANFLKLLDKGVGLVILHHANGAYNNWPEFWKIAGVEYHFGPWERNGGKMAPSGDKGGVKFRIHIADHTHPITRSLTDYDFVDETYCRTSIDPGIHPLLTTDEPSSDKIIGWTKTYRNSRVCYLQSGHNEAAYGNPVYRTLVIRALYWTARKLQ